MRAASSRTGTSYRLLDSGELVVENVVELARGARRRTAHRRPGSRSGPGSSASSWYGRGPWEDYSDRLASAIVGRFESTVADEYVPYIVPQEHGHHSDTRWLTLDERRRLRPAGRGPADDRILREPLHGRRSLRRRATPTISSRGARSSSTSTTRSAASAPRAAARTRPSATACSSARTGSRTRCGRSLASGRRAADARATSELPVRPVRAR